MTRIEVDIGRQLLRLFDGGRAAAEFPVSTAAKGAGERVGSWRTPRGRHRIRAKIGAGQALGAVFRGRRPTGEIWSPELQARYPGRDWILTRILWLGGEEPGVNRYGDVDTFRRYIYLHGTPPVYPVGVPGSHGCVRMRSEDILELFPRVQAGTIVELHE